MSEREPGKTAYLPSFPADEASAWRRIRKYAVPRWMIEQATERREAGDWRGACSAANVDVTFDLADVANQHGTETAVRLEDDLRHFAPDLMRWHLPRYLRGRTTIHPDRTVILARYGDRAPDGPFLHVAPLKMSDGPQRLILRFGEIRQTRDSYLSTTVRGYWQNWITLRHLWDARHAGELRHRCGADIPPHGEDVTERAFGTAGIELDHTPPRLRYQQAPPPLLQVLGELPLATTRLAPEARLLADAGFGRGFVIPVSWRIVLLLDLRRAGAPRMRLEGLSDQTGGGTYPLPEACWRRLPDLDLLRHGEITPADLHPLVCASLYPQRVALATDGPPDPAVPAALRVRCRGEWHEVRSADGQLRVPHNAQEQRREQAMRALGGPVTGCFAAQQAWTSGTGWLPKALRDQRRELFSRVQHGDTPGVVQLLDAGVDPHVRNGRQQTLLHLLHLLDHETLLPRLLRAGLDVEARDHHQRTPLHVMVGEGPLTAVTALLDAGARVDATDHRGMGLPDLIVWNGRAAELGFLKEAVERDYPNLAATYPSRETIF